MTQVPDGTKNYLLTLFAFIYFICQIPTYLPTLNKSVRVTIYDKDKLGNGEIIGTMLVPFHELNKPEYTHPRYYNLYGALKDGSGKESKQMNQYPELGSAWRGRVMLAFVSEDAEKPKYGT